MISSRSDFVRRCGFGTMAVGIVKYCYDPLLGQLGSVGSCQLVRGQFVAVSCRGPVYGTTLFQLVVVKLEWNARYYFC